MTSIRQFEQTALLLQGGGALGSYQGGVYQALSETNVRPDWVAGISIGAINAALIAGNPPNRRVERLRDFWETVSAPPLGPFGVPYMGSVDVGDGSARRFINQSQAMGVLLFGAPGFFKPRLAPPVFWSSPTASDVSFCEVAPLKATLERLVDFDRINAGDMRLSVGAVNVKSGNFVYFDTTTHRIRPEHVIASGSLPPGFPATEIDGEYYWDGGIVSNTPLQWVLDSRPRKDTLAIQIDLWNAHGDVPRNLVATESRLKDIQFSSRTRAATDQYKKSQKLRIALANVLSLLPDDAKNHPDYKILEEEANDKVCNIVQLIYRTKSHEGVSKDFEFSRRTMEDHWKDGYEDALNAIRHPEVLKRPTKSEGVHVFDFDRASSFTTRCR